MAGAVYYETAMGLLAEREAGAGWDELSARTGWQRSSVISIVSKARRGRIRPPGVPRKDSWEPEADAILEDFWERENSRQLARRISRVRPGTTVAAVNSRAHRLGLEKPNLYGNHAEWWSKNLEEVRPVS